MRGRERRLHTVATRLTVRQRVVALLAAEPGDDALRASLWRGLTPGERAAFRRDCARLDHLDATAHLCLAQAACQVGALEAVAGWFATVRLGAGVPELHHLLRALEIEVAACAAALGADPLDPALQTIADRCRARLRPLPDLPGLDPPIALTEPSDAEVAAFAARCRPEKGSDDAAW